MSENVTKDTSKKLGAKDIFLGVFCLCLFLDTATTSSAMGPTSIGWYVVIAIIVLLPMGLMIAELSSSYPSDGGLYHWIRISLGDSWASRTSWYYWLNIAIWMGSATIFITDVFGQMLTVMTGVEISFFSKLIAAVVLIWVYAFIAMRPLKHSTVSTNIGGFSKLFIIVALIVCAICYLAFNAGQVANDLSFKAIVPSPAEAFTFFPALVYNVVGMDAICAIGGNNVKNPKRDLPRMIITSIIVLALALIIANITILTITPLDQIDIINGIPMCFLITFGEGFGSVCYVVIAIIFLVTLLTQGPAWMQAGANMSVEAAGNGELPKAFGQLGADGTPKKSVAIMAIIGTALLVVYGILTFATNGGVDDLFWALFSFVSIIFFIPYILMFSAFIKLRKEDKSERAYRVPGPEKFLFFVARLDQVLFILTLVLFFYVPGFPFDAPYAIALAIGTICGIAVGEYFNSQRKKRLAAQKSEEFDKAE